MSQWKLVPVEPIGEMIEAGAEQEHFSVYGTDIAWEKADPDHQADYRSGAAAVYRAMLSASPAHPKGEEGGSSENAILGPTPKSADTEAEPSAREQIARLLYEIEPWRESGEYVEAFQVSPGGAVPWELAKRQRDEFAGSVDFAGPWSVVEDVYSTADAILALPFLANSAAMGPLPHVAPEAEPSGPVNCTHVLRRTGKPYPRTCERCRLGPCPFYNNDGSAKR
jgi:hypothetical protein